MGASIVRNETRSLSSPRLSDADFDEWWVGPHRPLVEEERVAPPLNGHARGSTR
jgi:hypothetical protein